MRWENRGINKYNGRTIKNKRFANDIILINDDMDNLKKSCTEVKNEGKEAGLEISLNKAKLISSNTKNDEVGIDKNRIEKKVSKAFYINQIISIENKTAKEINRRITLIWNKYWSLNYIFKGSFRSGT